jgi:hypothetical protein
MKNEKLGRQKRYKAKGIKPKAKGRTPNANCIRF